MRVAKKQNSAFLFKTSICIVDDAFACSMADFIKIFSAVNACSISIALYLEHIKSLQLSSLLHSETGRTFFSCIP